MTKPRRTLALAVAALAGAASLFAGGTASAACHPLLDPDFCEGITDPLPDRCVYYPEPGYIVCYWD